MEKDMRVVIIDDEIYARNALKELLGKYCPQLEIVGESNNAESGYNVILELDPDLVFLDIAMPRESGFDMLSRFDCINFEIIFVTGFDKHAIDAIEFSAIGYILKPISVEALMTAVSNAQKRVALKSENRHIKNLLTNINQRAENQNLAVPMIKSLEFVKISDIVRFEGVQKLTAIYTISGRKLMSSYNIGIFRHRLGNHLFYSPHKSHCINLQHIQKYLHEGYIVMVDGAHVPVAKRRRKEFLEMIKTL